MSQPIFYEGQAVGCLIHGEGVVREIAKKIIVDFREWTTTYFLTGQYYYENRPTLYPIDQYREIIANLPAPQPEPWQPKPGDWCWFWDDNNRRVAILNEFFRYEADKEYPYVTGTGTIYKHCAPFTGELPEHLKEVQP